MSSRKDVLITLVKHAKAIRNSSYFVKRGVIHWASWAFDKYPLAIAVMSDSAPLFGDSNGIKTGEMTVEIAGKMPAQDGDSPPSIDDDLMDKMMEDAQGIIEKTMAEKVRGDSVVFKIVKSSIEAIEFHDVARQVQGIVVTFTVTY